MPESHEITIRLTIGDPVPGVAYSLQDSASTPVGVVIAADGPLSFDVPVRVADGPKGPRFLGEFVRREGPERRFVYIAIGRQAGDGATHWSRRAKIDIHTLDPGLLAQALAGRVIEARLPGRDKRDGGPACATTPPLSWHALD
ncbi:DUF5990 family protein [Phenylobacterium sp.]|uniref:DUF5990 family protein n=1 Tax=Phenylobacterium sp. TaxID=1871053 RepID=UPI0025F58989|nr:DUF5990 family protein [Phenylobacterium sp.]MBX3482680.1 hypothetical protein [Phenylobacterium sp.]MCW5760456.1 hypothetical protein [Phenylobacterium sp.]